MNVPTVISGTSSGCWESSMARRRSLRSPLEKEMCVRPTPLTHACVEGGRSGLTVVDALSPYVH